MKHIKCAKNVNMKKLFRRNQIIITTLAVMIAAAGYLNYAGKKEVANTDPVFEAGMMEISDEDILAENQAMLSKENGSNLQEIPSWDVDLEDSAQMAKEGQDAAASDAPAAGESLADASQEGTETGLENPGEAVLTSGMSVTDYIANVQLSREQIRAKNKEALMGIINNTSIEESAKQQAIQDMLKLTEISEKENAAETLLMAKGFSDPVVSVTSGKVDVVINASSITDQQRAQIEDIVKRKTETAAENIVITLLNLAE